MVAINGKEKVEKTDPKLPFGCPRGKLFDHHYFLLAFHIFPVLLCALSIAMCVLDRL